MTTATTTTNIPSPSAPITHADGKITPVWWRFLSKTFDVGTSAVTGPASAGNGNVVSFNGTSGAKLQDSGVAAATLLANALTSARIFVGNVSNIAIGVAMGGDATIDNTGSVTVAKIGGKAVALGGGFTMSGAFASTFTVTGTTTVTFPTTGTLAALGGVNTWSSAQTFAVAVNFQGTSGAGVGVGTITNSHSAGNPADWIPVQFNGNTRYIPAWS